MTSTERAAHDNPKAAGDPAGVVSWVLIAPRIPPPRTRFHTRLQRKLVAFAFCALPLIGSFATLNATSRARQSHLSGLQHGSVVGTCARLDACARHVRKTESECTSILHTSAKLKRNSSLPARRCSTSTLESILDMPDCGA